ncbi:hypothetical protein EYC80_003157 [Monilinia laxa]|uniref:Uncharacterized protein n=1 Tax=Monilinia laxa TaxID=61186 RepID=A0A5N6KE50_MONLA|nr:hypothetical protein EYC80_003157 [Monilinia laxa]
MKLTNYLEVQNLRLIRIKVTFLIHTLFSALPGLGCYWQTFLQHEHKGNKDKQNTLQHPPPLERSTD